jgi:hypothetical protein
VSGQHPPRMGTLPSTALNKGIQKCQRYGTMNRIKGHVWRPAFCANQRQLGGGGGGPRINVTKAKVKLSP